MWSNSCSRKPDADLPPRGRRSLLRDCLLACLLCCAFASGPCDAADWHDELPRAVALGDGELHWLGFRIYHATLWSEQRPFQPERGFALQLHYYRSISRQRLVQTSLDEMARLNGASVDPATLAQWGKALSGAFTDVVPGDELVGVYAPGHGMRFYNQQGLLADIGDLRLAHAFFGIWLDERSRDQDLRGKLMGTPP